MPSHTLSRRQRQHLLEWIAEGLSTEQIRTKAEEFEPAFEAGKALVCYYRRKCKVEIERLEEDYKEGALRSGIARRLERISELKTVAELMKKDLLAGKMWTERIEMNADGGTKATMVKFNESFLRQYRGVLEDIAREVGDRSGKKDPEVIRDPLDITVEYVNDPLANRQGE